MRAAEEIQANRGLQPNEAPRNKREVVAATALLLSMMSLALSMGNLVLSQLTSTQLI